ncbi:TBC domain-containing [Cryptosporidium xiaoi]|uniref:TBC domain-containing n=1 Tax=Cryptosporidium xiaoi TaxID=659607 RepID=A0AAV9Y2L0_9CRYT
MSSFKNNEIKIGQELEKAKKECKELFNDSPEEYYENSYEKWNRMVSKGLDYFRKNHLKTYKRRLSRGVPQEFRWRIWNSYLDVNLSNNENRIKDETGNNSSNNSNDDITETNQHLQMIVRNSSFYTEKYTPESPKGGNNIEFQRQNRIYINYYDYAAKYLNKYSSLISFDVPRTFPELDVFREKDSQECLYRVLNAIANHIPEVGYCQGMNFIAALLLMVSDFDQERSFYTFIIILEAYGLSGFYKDNFPLLSKYIQAFNTLFQTNIPKLWKHFQDEGIFDPVYLHPWFLTMFVSTLPLKTVVILWDYLLANGLHSLITIAIALLKIVESTLLDQSMESIIQFFKSLRISVGLSDITCARMLLSKAKCIDISDEIMSSIKI